MLRLTTLQTSFKHKEDNKALHSQVDQSTTKLQLLSDEFPAWMMRDNLERHDKDNAFNAGPGQRRGG